MFEITTTYDSAGVRSKTPPFPSMMDAVNHLRKYWVMSPFDKFPPDDQHVMKLEPDYVELYTSGPLSITTRIQRTVEPEEVFYNTKTIPNKRKVMYEPHVKSQMENMRNHILELFKGVPPHEPQCTESQQHGSGEPC